MTFVVHCLCTSANWAWTTAKGSRVYSQVSSDIHCVINRISLGILSDLQATDDQKSVYILSSH